MNNVLREPLLHFLLLGGALFAVHGWLGSPPGGDGERIVITQGRVEQLASGFSRMHQRRPDALELEALVDEAIREEIYYREAKALALDEDDTIVRRRLRQKLEFVTEDVAPIAEPDERQLQAYLQSHPEMFRGDRHYSLTHVYLDPALHGAQLNAHAGQLLARLQREGASGAVLRGDPFPLGARFDDMAGGELARLFGAGFEEQLRDSHVGQWQGPVSSSYGAHLVLMRGRTGQQAPRLAAVRGAVRTEWVRAQRLAANERFYADLRKRYSVTVMRPASPGPVAARFAGALP